MCDGLAAPTVHLRTCGIRGDLLGWYSGHRLPWRQHLPLKCRRAGQLWPRWRQDSDRNSQLAPNESGDGGPYPLSAAEGTRSGVHPGFRGLVPAAWRKRTPVTRGPPCTQAGRAPPFASPWGEPGPLLAWFIHEELQSASSQVSEMRRGSVCLCGYVRLCLVYV